MAKYYSISVGIEGKEGVASYLRVIIPTVLLQQFPFERYLRDMAFHTLHDSLDRTSQITGQALLGVDYDPTVKH